MNIVVKTIILELNKDKENKMYRPLNIEVKNTPANRRSEFLAKVDSIVTSDRSIIHGPPEDSFNTIANLWNAYLNARPRNDENHNQPLTIFDVALMMDLLKTARLATNPTNLDSWLDKAGYVTCGGSLLIVKED